MGRCFAPGTALGEIEAGMRRIPGFTPRRSGFIRESGDDGKNGRAPYGELLWRFAREIPSSNLEGRVMGLTVKEGGMEFTFRNGWHEKRFRGLLKSGDYGFLFYDYGLAAAAYLLSADTFLWGRAKGFIAREGIRFGGIRVHGVDPDGYALFCAAKAVLGRRPGLSLSELGDEELIGDGLLKVILSGILISRHGLSVMGKEEKGEVEAY